MSATEQDRRVLDPVLLEMLVCPESQGMLEYDRAQELICRQSGLAYPIRDGVPVLIVSEARHLDTGQ